MRDYLAQGVSASTASTTGMGKAHRVASNDTAEGHQRNRRVDMVVTGERIVISSNGRILAERKAAIKARLARSRATRLQDNVTLGRTPAKSWAVRPECCCAFQKSESYYCTGMPPLEQRIEKFQ